VRGGEYRGCGKTCAKSHGEPETQAARLAGKPRRPLGPKVKIIADGRARYPDAIVVCRPVSPTVADDPVVVFEVLSEGSSETDLIDKNREYRATPSIQCYVVLQQTHRAAIVFVRRQDGWLSEIVWGDDARLDSPEIGIAVPLHEVYANAGLPEAPQGGTAV
jgi:Uma2 family endonuclease